MQEQAKTIASLSRVASHLTILVFPFAKQLFFLFDNLVLSTGLIMRIVHRKEIRKLTFRALALRRSAPESLYGGQFIVSTQLIEPNYLVILPPTQHRSFFRNLPPLFICFFVWFPQKRNGIVFSSGVNYLLHSGVNIQSELSS